MLDKLHSFWIFMTTPGSQLPTSTTIITIIVIALVSFLLPTFVRWRAQRRPNVKRDFQAIQQQKQTGAQKDAAPQKKTYASASGPKGYSPKNTSKKKKSK